MKLWGPQDSELKRKSLPKMSSRFNNNKIFFKKEGKLHCEDSQKTKQGGGLVFFFYQELKMIE